MPMNPNFLCCIGAELKNSTQQTTRMSQIYFYRAFENETVTDMLEPGFFDAAMGIVRKDDLLLLYDSKDESARWTYCRVSNVTRTGVEISLMGINAADVLVERQGEDPVTLQYLIDNIILPDIESLNDSVENLNEQVLDLQTNMSKTMPLDSMLVPNLDKRTPIATYEFDSSGATYKPILRIPNDHSNQQDIPILNAVFRMTATREGVKTVCDCIVTALQATNGPLILMRNHPGSANSSDTGIDYFRTTAPKVFNNGYDWYFEIRNPNTNIVHTKVEVYSSDPGIIWIADGTLSTYNATYQTQTSTAMTTINGFIWSQTMPWTVSTSNSAGYINSYLNKFISGSLPVMGVSANAQSLVLLGTDKKFYPMSSTTVAIDPGFGAAVLGGAVASGSAVSWTNLSSKRRTGTAEIPTNTLTIGESCYLRCTMDSSGNIYSDNYVDTQMSAGYTWLYIGQAENATTIEVNTDGSQFYTLDSNGYLTHINGKAVFDTNAANKDLSNLTTTGKENISKQGTYDSNETYTAGTVGAELAKIDNKADKDLSNLTANGKGKLGPLVYQVIGYVVNSATAGSNVAAYGICRVELYPNGLAIVDFNLHFTAPGTNGDYNWGLNRDILRTLNANIPIITPIDGTCSYYDASGIYSGTLNGNAGTLISGNPFWRFGRLYDTAGNIGGWDASAMSANIKVVGRCYGTYTV